MDKNQFGASVLLFIETNFPGGTVEFNQQGGIVSLSPFNDDILIYLPDMPEMFRDKIKTFNTDNNFKIIIRDTLNFTGVDPIDQVNNVCIKIKDKYQTSIILFNMMNPLIFIVSIPFTVLSDEAVDDILKILSEIKDVVSGCLDVGGVTYAFSSEVIDDKAIRDIRATLANDLDVLEFIKML